MCDGCIRSATVHMIPLKVFLQIKHTLTKCAFSVILKLKEVGAMEQIIQLISNVGFPIACCIFLFSQQTKLTNTLHDISTTMQLMSARLDDIEDALRKGGKENGKKEKN